jgi:hypothetical protein
MVWSPLPGSLPLDVAQTRHIARHGGIAPGIVPRLELAEESQGVTAAGIPTVEERGGIGAKQTATAVRTAFAHGQGLRPEIAGHGMLANPQRLGNGPLRPSLLVVGPDRLMERPPARPLLVRAGGRG